MYIQTHIQQTGTQINELCRWKKLRSNSR